jgi:hypothetical protein
MKTVVQIANELAMASIKLTKAANLLNKAQEVYSEAQEAYFKAYGLPAPYHKSALSAAEMGRKGGKAGRGACKARSSEQARAAALARWRKPSDQGLAAK